LALLPTVVPRRGVLCSALFHTALVAMISWMPFLFPDRPVIVLRTGRDLVRESIYAPIEDNKLPSIPDSGGGSGGGGGSEGQKGASGRRAEGSALRAALPKAVYAGNQEIISNLPDATNTVQTIRRPDLIAPPKLKYPMRVKSMVIMPVPSMPALIAPPAPNPSPEVADSPKVVVEPTVEHPVLPVRVPKRLRQVALETPNAPVLTPQGTMNVDLTHHAVPTLSPDAPTGPKAAVVINAVNVPAHDSLPIPDAEVSGSFAVTVAAPSGPTSAEGGTLGGGGRETGSGSGSGHGGAGSAGGTGTGDHGTGTGANGSGRGTGSGGSGSGSGTGPGTGTGTGIGPGSGAGRGGGSGSGTGPGAGSGTGSGSGAGTGIGSGRGNGGLPGISISGGSSGRVGSNSVKPTLRGSYAITIISGGSSGGASRDAGVFGRNETVYTVYIPMGDGGPDSSMQYAMPAAGTGLPSPPVVLKKVRPVLTKGQEGDGPGQVFVAGTIDDNGKPQGLRALRADDARSAAVLAALAQWDFEPAELNGKAVPVKILIGITIVAPR
jgi:hypothetical protein